MTSKIPMKVVLPFLVIIVVIVSVMQLGKPSVVVLLQTHRSTNYHINPTEDFIDANGATAGAIASLNLQNGNYDNYVKYSETDNSGLEGEINIVLQLHPSTKPHSQSTVEQTVSFQGHQAVILKDQCKEAKNKLVFIKTHKTASTTVATIFERYGYEHNLTFALPWVMHIFHESKLFNHDMVMTLADQNTFDMLVNHARFNKKEMEVVVPGAKFVTVIRDPVTQFESAFGYFEMAKSLGLAEEKDPLAAFLDNPQKYNGKSFHMKVQSYNGQIYDLGLNHQFHNDTREVERHINKLDKELDLVMLTEYIDESLILLRKLMCWSYEDILYVSKGVRNKKHHYGIIPEIAEEIRKWNRADSELYRHFNHTFWQQVNKYGPDFDRDLQIFRQLQKNMTNMCLNTNREGWSDYRETSYAKKKNAPDICNDLLRDDQEYVLLIRWWEVRTEYGIGKLLAMITGGIILLIILLTALLFIICKLVQQFCGQRKSNSEPTLDSKCEYSKLNPNSEDDL